VVQQQYARADLLVVGKRACAAPMDFFFGSVALRVLRWCSADLLIVPHEAPASRWTDDLRAEAPSQAPTRTRTQTQVATPAPRP